MPSSHSTAASTSSLTGIASCAGQQQGIPLPYRGQLEPVLPSEEELEGVPEGYCREVMLRGRMVRSLTSTHAPSPHAGLGLPAYVQFTSPIRRYGDLLAHWQIKVSNFSNHACCCIL